MPNPTMPLGRIIWYETMTSDTAKSQDFYTKLFGWTAAPSPGSEMAYTILSHNGAGFGGMMKLPPEAAKMGAPPHWLMYVATPDVDASAAQAKSLGAQVYAAPMDIPGMGRFAVLGDPQSATFALFTATSPGSDAPRTPGYGEVAWNELATTDHGAAFTFYQKMFGWEQREPVDMGPHGIYQLWGRAGHPNLGGMYNKTPEMPVNAWCYYVRVQDLEGSTAKAKSLGATIILEPMEVPNGDRIAVFADPVGAVLGIVWVKPLG